MLSLWNNGLHRLSHAVPASEDPIAERPRLVREFVQCIATHLLHVDSSPTLSRFFTCRDCIDRMLVMHLIGMVRYVLRVRKVKPRKENQKRLSNVLTFFKHDGAGQTLAGAALTSS